MADENNHSPTLGVLARRIGRTALGALENRGELLTVEWQQEKARLTQMLLLSVALMFLGLVGVFLLTATIIFLFPEEYWRYAAAGFTVLYLGGAVAAFIGLKKLLKGEPFAETLKQLRKDRDLLEPFE